MLEHLFGSKTRVKLLQIFFRSSGRPFYVRELARAAFIQLNAVRREIANLLALGIVMQVAAPAVGDVELGTERSKYYQLNTASLLYHELKALLTKAAILEEESFVRDIRERSGTIGLLVLTGVFTGDAEVDTDVLIVGKVKPMVLSKIIRKYERDSGRSLRYTIMDAREFKDRRQLGDKFLYRIFEAKRVVPIDELKIGS